MKQAVCEEGTEGEENAGRREEEEGMPLDLRQSLGLSVEDRRSGVSNPSTHPSVFSACARLWRCCSEQARHRQSLSSLGCQAP